MWQTHRTVRAGVGALMLASASAHPQSGGETTWPPPSETLARPVAARPRPTPICDARVATVMITDDPYSTPEDLAGQWRSLGLPQPHALVRRFAESDGCLETLSPDPLLLALPGAPLPDVIVRIRPARLMIAEKTIGDKIDAGVRGYIESYTAWLGAKSTTEGPPLLREAGITVSLLCPRSRKVVREFDQVDADPAEPLVQNGENTAARQNTARVERAIARAHFDLVSLLRPKPCADTVPARGAHPDPLPPVPPPDSMAPFRDANVPSDARTAQ